MTEGEIDLLFGQVFATPQGKRLLDALERRRQRVITVSDIETRVGRMRKFWQTGEGVL